MKIFIIDKKKIFFLILFVNIIALILTISNSYTDGYNLRQAQTAIMTRNIFYDNFNIFPTRLSHFAPEKGNLIFEFPFLHFLTALTYKVFPISEINGRLINLLFYIFNGYLFYKIQKLIFDDEVAIVTSSLFISSPIIFFLAHAYMPETSMLSPYLISYYLFLKNKFEYKRKNEILMFFSLAIAPLLKAPAGIIYLPIFLDYLDKININSLIKKSLPFILCALPFCLWSIYGETLNYSQVQTTLSRWSTLTVLIDRGSVFEYWFSFNFYKNIISNFLIQHLNPLTFILSIYGLIINFRSKDPIIKFHINWLLGNILFIFIFAGVNLGHPYYQIFFIPNLIFFIGLSLIKIKKIFRNKNLIFYGCILLNLILSFSIFTYGTNEKLRISNLDEFKNVFAKNITIDKNDPKEFILYSHEGMATPAVYTYYSDTYSNLFKIGEEDLSKLKEKIDSGAKYIFFVNTSYGETLKTLKQNEDLYKWLNSNKIKLYESENMILYKLRK